jgi:hypothetical protein
LSLTQSLRGVKRVLCSLPVVIFLQVLDYGTRPTRPVLPMTRPHVPNDIPNMILKFPMCSSTCPPIAPHFIPYLLAQVEICITYKVTKGKHLKIIVLEVEIFAKIFSFS